MERQEVYKLIDGERNYQDNLSELARYRQKTVAEELVIIERYTRKALDAWTDNPGDEAALDVVRKIAATCIRCMEVHGAPSRGSLTRDSV